MSYKPDRGFGLALGLYVAAGTAAVTGLIGLLLRERDRATLDPPPAPVRAVAKAEPGKADPPKRVKIAGEPLPAIDKRDAVAAQYRAARDIRDRLAAADAKFLEELPYDRYVSAVHCLTEVRAAVDAGDVTAAGVRDEIVHNAFAAAPELVRAVLFERDVRAGRADAYPLDKRKELWPEFAKVAGWREWSPAQPFNRLTRAETDRIISIVRGWTPAGVFGLDWKDRALFLKAGAWPLFRDAVGDD